MSPSLEEHPDTLLWCAGMTPILEKGSSCSENCSFRATHVVRCHSENELSHSENHFLNSEVCSEQALELAESSENGLFTPRAFFGFLKLGPQAVQLQI